ncbi:TM2 domain-containing protein [Roseospirillum parvum]|uniref:TM2 domain-containing protein n=1 Tax=Roseospirillum parvum TaxID=83401 RepID=A0A1G8CN54_9PROT|nr:TM2 domain-containing protein [Roseospirillum parvum]SDH46908.1 TM2 domain-containing protein [Roseospirillum parvum]
MAIDVKGPAGIRPGTKYCMACGTAMPSLAAACPRCGFTNPSGPAGPPQTESPKSFGVAVALCGIFGVVGIHHFYLGNIVHGLIDLGLLVGGLSLIFLGQITLDPMLVGLGVVVLLIDALHSLVVMVRLIIGKAHDGKGRPVRYRSPG